jgi:hypothetical protein
MPPSSRRKDEDLGELLAISVEVNPREDGAHVATDGVEDHPDRGPRMIAAEASARGERQRLGPRSGFSTSGPK